MNLIPLFKKKKRKGERKKEKKRASKHFREENFSPNVHSIDNWIRRCGFIEKRDFFISFYKCQYCKAFDRSSRLPFYFTWREASHNSLCKTDGCFRNLPIWGFHINHSEGTELIEVKHVFSNHTEKRSSVPIQGYFRLTCVVIYNDWGHQDLCTTYEEKINRLVEKIQLKKKKKKSINQNVCCHLTIT